MPSDWLYIDTNFPSFTGEEDLEQRVTTMQNYLFMLVEQFRYTLHNLDLSNMNSAAVEQFSTSLTDPIYARIGDDERNLTQLQLTAQGLAGRISDAEGNITQLGATAAGLASRVSDNEGNISALSQTAAAMSAQISDLNGNISSVALTVNGLTSRVSDSEGNISALSQTVNGFGLSASNGTNSSYLYLTSNGAVIDSALISFSGMVSFTDLSTPGATTICGGNIDTNTLKVSDLYGQYVYLRNSTGTACGRLSVSGAVSAAMAVDLESYGALRLTADYGDVYIESGNGNYVHLTSGGVVIGNDDLLPNINAGYDLGSSSQAWLRIYTSGGVIETSDLTKKNSIVYGLDDYDAFFDGLKPISYLFNMESGGQRHIGLGAQDVERDLIDCGLTGSDFAGLVKSPKKDDAGQVIEGEYDYALRYTEFIPLLIEQVQKLKNRVNELEARL